MSRSTDRLFVACTVSLVASAIGFVVRAFLLNELGLKFNLSETQLGSIQGAGLYPQAVTMVLSALVVDRIGYKRAMGFGFVCHVLSALILMTAGGYASLYWGTFIFALAGGIVEGVINPVTATLYPKNKTHYLNILHAGWPGGMVLGGLLVITLGSAGGEDSWRWKMGIYLIPTLIYGWMMLREKFPVQERVAAGISYLDMLNGFTYRPLDKARVSSLPAAEQSTVEQVRAVNNQATLGSVAVLPAIMLVCYLGLILHFKMRGGYREVLLAKATSGTPS